MFTLLSSCGIHKYGISRDVNPKEDVHVFLHPKIIISGIKLQGKTRKIDETNNERAIFDFFIPSGEQEIFLKTAYTHQIYAFSSNSIGVILKADKGDMVFVCASIREIGSRRASGGIVETLLTPTLLYLKTDEEKNKVLTNNVINKAYFDERCNAAMATKP